MATASRRTSSTGRRRPEGLVRHAGAHPFEQRVDFELTKNSGIDPQDGTRYVVAKGTVKTVEVTLPRGMIGNPEATPKCNPVDFGTAGSTGDSTGCPANTQVGYLNIHATAGTNNYGRGNLGLNPFFQGPDRPLSRVAIYNMVPPKGKAADFAFNAGAFVMGHIYPELDPAQNYAIKTVTPGNLEPGAADRGRSGRSGACRAIPRTTSSATTPNSRRTIPPWGPNSKAPRCGRFLTNPMDCGFDNGGARNRVEFYQHPGVFSPVQEYPDPLNVTGCNDQRIRFHPKVAIQPDNTAAGGPTGLDVHLEVPQRNDEAKEAKELYDESGEAIAIATPPMKRVVTTFPEGMTLSPSAAQGLGTCTAAQIGLGTNSPVTCPDNSASTAG